MHLLTDKLFLEDFGQCSGMGRCGTCAIIIEKGDDHINVFDRNEGTTLQKAGILNLNTRLACQIEADSGINGLQITIPLNYNI